MLPGSSVLLLRAWVCRTLHGSGRWPGRLRCRCKAKLFGAEHVWDGSVCKTCFSYLYGLVWHWRLRAEVGIALLRIVRSACHSLICICIHTYTYANIIYIYILDRGAPAITWSEHRSHQCIAVWIHLHKHQLLQSQQKKKTKNSISMYVNVHSYLYGLVYICVNLLCCIHS